MSGREANGHFQPNFEPVSGGMLLQKVIVGIIHGLYFMMFKD